ncbi:MAG: hypothetical protein K0S23_2298 [Fluviicola sp.]|jgi:hypothetical protein|uniref:hypothetical protein n=1 Tax=Fluviicola sp. TaxID=1917219 RepID=UPI00260E0A73|nr:hypothetical protein [Fluviicola sp.]MDF3027991.1 hypothetical protein [Fluviicola sp.]
METELIKEIQTREIPYEDLKVVFPFLENKINLENKLEMEIAEVRMIDSLPQLSHFQNIVRLKDTTTPLNKDVLEIHRDAFKKLYLDSVAMPQATGNYITAVKIWLGLDVNNKLKPLFQPICIQKNNENDYLVHSNERVYHYDNSKTNEEKFQPIAITEVEGLKKRYRKGMEIFHLNETVFRNFIRDLDTEAVIYPFQTIYTLIFDNLEANDCVTLRNSIATNRQSGNLDNKHSILLYATKAVDKEIRDFRNKYANRSHLCPPGSIEIADLDLF